MSDENFCLELRGHIDAEGTVGAISIGFDAPMELRHLGAQWLLDAITQAWVSRQPGTYIETDCGHES